MQQWKRAGIPCLGLRGDVPGGRRGGAVQRTEMGCRGRPCVRAVGMACHSCAIESGMARGWPMRMSSDGAIKKDSRSPCRHCARRPPANCSGGWLGVHASDLTADARGRATAMTCQYRDGRCATRPRTGEVPVPRAKKRRHFSCRLVDRKPVVRVGCFARAARCRQSGQAWRH